MQLRTMDLWFGRRHGCLEQAFGDLFLDIERQHVVGIRGEQNVFARVGRGGIRAERCGLSVRTLCVEASGEAGQAHSASRVVELQPVSPNRTPPAFSRPTHSIFECVGRMKAPAERFGLVSAASVRLRRSRRWVCARSLRRRAGFRVVHRARSALCRFGT